MPTSAPSPHHVKWRDLCNLSLTVTWVAKYFESCLWQLNRFDFPFWHGLAWLKILRTERWSKRWVRSFCDWELANHVTICWRRRRECQLGGLSLMRSLRNPNRKPTHPGAVLREDVLPELAWTQGEFATRLMVSRQTIRLTAREKSCHSGDGHSHFKSSGWNPWELASHARGFGPVDSRNQVQKEPFDCTQSIGCLKEKKSLHCCKGFLFGSSTWARTRDLRINRKVG